MSDDIRHIEEPERIRWRGNRSLLLTLRHVLQVLPENPDLVADLLILAHNDARQIIEDADTLIKAVRSNTENLFPFINELAETIDGELEADDAAEEDQGGDDEDE